jgi:hypothetical protein
MIWPRLLKIGAKTKTGSPSLMFCTKQIISLNRQVELLGSPSLRPHFPVINGKLLPYKLDVKLPRWNVDDCESLLPHVKCGLHCDAQAFFERNSDGTAAFDQHGPLLDQVFVATMNCRSKGAQQLSQAERDSKVQFLLDAAYSAT